MFIRAAQFSRFPVIFPVLKYNFNKVQVFIVRVMSNTVVRETAAKKIVRVEWWLMWYIVMYANSFGEVIIKLERKGNISEMLKKTTAQEKTELVS